jgi:hypothetical protein
MDRVDRGARRQPRCSIVECPPERSPWGQAWPAANRRLRASTDLAGPDRRFAGPNSWLRLPSQCHCKLDAKRLHAGSPAGTAVGDKRLRSKVQSLDAPRSTRAASRKTRVRSQSVFTKPTWQAERPFISDGNPRRASAQCLFLPNPTASKRRWGSAIPHRRRPLDQATAPWPSRPAVRSDRKRRLCP